MERTQERLAQVALLTIPAAIAGFGMVLSLLPHNAAREVVTLLLAWTSLSLPVGIAFGHFVPEEEPSAIG